MFADIHLEMATLEQQQKLEEEKKRNGHSWEFTEDEYQATWIKLKRMPDKFTALFIVRKLALTRRWPSSMGIMISTLFPAPLQLNIMDFLMLRFSQDSLTRNKMHEITDFFHASESSSAHILNIVGKLDLASLHRHIGAKGILAEPLLRSSHLVRSHVDMSVVDGFVTSANKKSSKSANTDSILRSVLETGLETPLGLKHLKIIFGRTQKWELMCRLFSECRQSVGPLSVEKLIDLLWTKVKRNLTLQLKCFTYLSVHVVDPEHMWHHPDDPEPSTNWATQYFQREFGTAGRIGIQKAMEAIQHNHGLYPCSPFFGSMVMNPRKDERIRKFTFVLDCGATMNTVVITNQGEKTNRYNFLVRDLMRVIIEQLHVQDKTMRVNVLRCSSSIPKANWRCFKRPQALTRSNVERISRFLRSGDLPTGQACLMQAMKMAFADRSDEIYLVTDSSPSDKFVVAQAKARLQGTGHNVLPPSKDGRKMYDPDKSYFERMEAQMKEGQQDEECSLVFDAAKYYWTGHPVPKVYSAGIFLGLDHRDEISRTRTFLRELAVLTGGSYRILTGFVSHKDLAKSRTNTLVKKMKQGTKNGGKSKFGAFNCCAGACWENKKAMKQWHVICTAYLVASYLIMLICTYFSMSHTGFFKGKTNCLDLYAQSTPGVAPARYVFKFWSVLYILMAISIVCALLPDRRHLYKKYSIATSMIYQRMAKSNGLLGTYCLLNAFAFFGISSGSLIGAFPFTLAQAFVAFLLYKTKTVKNELRSYAKPHPAANTCQWIVALIFGPLWSLLLSWTILLNFFPLFGWIIEEDKSLFAVTYGWVVLALLLMSAVSVFVMFRYNDFVFGIPMVTFKYGLLEKWSVITFTDSDTAFEPRDNMKIILRVAFVLLIVEATFITVKVVHGLLAYWQVTATKFALAPDRSKMRGIIYKQVLNVCCFVIMALITLYRTSTYDVKNDSAGGNWYGTLNGFSSPLEGVCGNDIQGQLQHLTYIIPSTWFFSLVWALYAYLAFMIGFQMMPYTFMTASGKRASARNQSLGLRVSYIRNVQNMAWVGFEVPENPRCCGCTCPLKRRFCAVIPRFWNWGLTKASYRVLHTRMSSWFIYICLLSVGFQMLFALGQAVPAYVVLTAMLVCLVMLIHRVGAGLNFGSVAHKLPQIEDARYSLNAQKKQQQKEQRRESIKRRHDAMAEQQSNMSNEEDVSCCPTSPSEIWDRIQAKREKMGNSLTREIAMAKEGQFASKSLLWGLYFPISLFIGWTMFVWTVMTAYVFRGIVDEPTSVIVNVVVLHLGTLFASAFAVWRHDTMCLYTFLCGLVAVCTMSTLQTCDTNSYSGHDYRNNYSPPLQVQWAVETAAECVAAPAQDRFNISNNYGFIDGKCRVMQGYIGNILTGTLELWAYTGTDQTMEELEEYVGTTYGDFSGVISKVKDDSNFTTTEFWDIEDRYGDDNHSFFVDFKAYRPTAPRASMYPVIEDTSHFEDVFARAMLAEVGVANSNETGLCFGDPYIRREFYENASLHWTAPMNISETCNFTANEYTRQLRWDLNTESVCVSSELSLAQETSLAHTPNEFPSIAKRNRGLGFFATELPLPGRGYCAGAPGTCSDVEFGYLLFPSGRPTVQARMFASAAIDVVFVCLLIVCLLLKGKCKRMSKNKHSS